MKFADKSRDVFEKGSIVISVALPGALRLSGYIAISVAPMLRSEVFNLLRGAFTSLLAGDQSLRDTNHELPATICLADADGIITHFKLTRIDVKSAEDIPLSLSSKNGAQSEPLS